MEKKTKTYITSSKEPAMIRMSVLSPQGDLLLSGLSLKDHPELQLRALLTYSESLSEDQQYRRALVRRGTRRGLGYEGLGPRLGG